jgi:hypothetical protein
MYSPLAQSFSSTFTLHLISVHSHALPHICQHAKFQNNPFMFEESGANKNVLHFHAKKSGM